MAFTKRDVIKAVNDMPNIKSQLEDIANKGTTVEILERVTKEEIDRQVADGTIANLTIANDSITTNKTTFFNCGKNLFDKSKAQQGFINFNDGTVSSHATYYCTGYIELIEGAKYSYTNIYNMHYAFYNSNKQFITSATNNIPTPFTCPAGAKYIRMTILNVANVATAQLELGALKTTYESFTPFLKQEMLNIKNVEYENVCNNLIDINRVTRGNYVDYSSGNLVSHATYITTDFIEVLGDITYCINDKVMNTHFAFYDQYKKYINNATNSINRTGFTTPTNAKYMRFTISSEQYLYLAQMEKGTTITDFTNGKYAINKNNLQEYGQLKVFLPSEICVAVGRTIELYNNQVAWSGNLENYHFQWVCDIGKAMKRKFSVTGTTPLIGEYTLKLNIYDNNMYLVKTVSTTLKIISNVIATGKTILTIGDSLNNEKPTLGEVRTLSNNKYTFVGTRKYAPLQHEARSGFSAMDYLTNKSYSFEGEGVQPFYNSANSRFDWNYYKTKTGITPNAVNIFLGTNGITVDATINANAIKQMVDYIKQDDSTVQIFITFTLYRGNQNGLGVQQGTEGYSVNKGAWKAEEDLKVFNLMEQVYALLKNYTNVHFIPVSLCHDSEFNYGSVETPVNPRATQTELLPNEATHPQAQGYMQIADITFSAFAKYL